MIIYLIFAAVFGIGSIFMLISAIKLIYGTKYFRQAIMSAVVPYFVASMICIYLYFAGGN